MKPKAIISWLWSSQHEALGKFLMMHEPLAVIVPSSVMQSDPYPSAQLQEVVRMAGCYSVSLDSFLDAATVHELDAEIVGQRGKFQKYLQQQAIAQQVSVELATILYGRAHANLPTIIHILECLKKASEQFDIALFVTSEDITTVGKLATAWANARGIPSLCVAHSAILVEPITVADQLVAATMAVYGERAKDGYLDLGYSDERIVVTGNPAWEGYAELRKSKAACRRQLDQRYKFDPEWPLVVFAATSPSEWTAMSSPEISIDTAQVFIAACEELRQGGVRFNAVIKDRPSNFVGGQNRIGTLLSGLGAAASGYVHTGQDAQLFAAAADVLIGVNTNLLIEGMLARTPGINLLYDGGMLAGPWFSPDSGILEAEPQELAGAIHLLLHDEGVRNSMIDMQNRNACDYNYGDCDGESSMRVAQLMKKIAKPLIPRRETEMTQMHPDVETDLARDVFPSLNELYSSHKGKVSDKWSLYLNEYDHQFMPWRNKAVSLLEIGVQNGGSLEIWSRFFPQASRLIGCDINPDCAKLSYEDSRISVVVGNANTDATQAHILQLSRAFDIVIDDGSHSSSDIVKSFARYFPYVKQGGIFVAEDLHCSYWRQWEGGLHYPYSSIAFFKRLSDIVNFEHWGVPGGRALVLKGFFSQYGIELSEDDLAQIHSIEFINSICVVRKRPAGSNELGARIVTGQVEAVVPVKQLAQSSSKAIAIDQMQNPWSTLNKAPDEFFSEMAQTIGRLNKELEQKTKELEDLKAQQAVQRTPGVLILDAGGESHKVQLSLEALAAGPYRNLPVVVLTAQEGAVPEWTDTLRYFQVQKQEYADAVGQLSASPDFHWLAILEAGAATAGQSKP